MRIFTLAFLLVTSVFAQLMDPAGFPVVNAAGVDITGGKIDSLSQQLAAQQFRGKQVPPQAMEQVRMMVVENLVAAELVKKEVATRKIKAPKARVDSLYKIMQAQAPSKDVFQKHMKKMGLNEAQFRKKLSEQVQTEVLLEKIAPYPAPATQAEIKKYFEENKAKLPKNDTVAAFQIFLDVGAKEAKEAVAEKKSLLEGFASQVRLGKADFRQLAAQYSDESEAKKTGGSMGRFGLNAKGTAYGKAIQSMKVGEISKVFRSKNKLVLLMLMERNDGKFESYKYKVEYLLAVKAEEDRMLKLKTFIETLVNKYGVKFYNESYKPKQKIGENFMKKNK